MVGIGEAGDPVGGGGEEGAAALLGCLCAQADREVGFACAGWPEQDEVGGGV